MRARPMKNVEFNTPVYERACKLAGIPPTKRQASRWRNGKGLARRFLNLAIHTLAVEARAKEIKA